MHTHSSQHPVLVRARALNGFSALVEAHQGNVNALLESVGLCPAILDTPEATLSLAVFVELLERSATALSLDDLGLQLARRYELTLPPHAPRRQGIELSYGVAIDFLRLLSPAPIDDWQIWFRHTDGSSSAHYRERFGCPVQLGQDMDALIVPLTLLDAPVNPGSPELLHMGERFVSSVMRRFPLDIAAQVESLVLQQLATRECTLPHIAQQLGLHQRTLQRRLAAQAMSFEGITDKVRKMRAQEYLPLASIPLQQVASLLGYSEQSSFSRACLRWFGHPPEQVRKQGK